MQAEIKKETDDGYGVLVIDNNNAEHKIGVCFDGAIDGHLCDSYADDPANRSTGENVYNEQAREFAKYYVYRERGYETLDPQRNPDRIAAAMLAVSGLSTRQFEQYFGDTYQQLLSHQDDATPLLEIPSSVDRDLLRAGQDIYLSDDGEFADGLEDLTQMDTYDELEAAAGQDADSISLDELHDVLTDLDVDLSETAEYVGDALVETTGPVAIRWEISQDRDETRTAGADHTIPAREPDVRPDMIAEMFVLNSVEDFQEALAHHLRCQVRDCYVEMGVAPPELFRVTGPGFYENIGWYANHDFYPRYYNYHAEIDDWQDEQALDDLAV